MIYSIPKYINNLKSQKIKFVKLNIHVPNLDAIPVTGICTCMVTVDKEIPGRQCCFGF